MKVPVKVGRNQPRMGWKQQTEKDMLRVGIQKGDVWDRRKWKHDLHAQKAIEFGEKPLYVKENE